MTAITSKRVSTEATDVVRLRDVPQAVMGVLLARYGLSLELVEAGADIPGSYWGNEEAGLIGRRLLARPDTPLHSVLHETCHYVCMDQTRRRGLNTDAGGDYAEENAVCYLQILLADHIGDFGRQRMFHDMDHWGYTFRLGSAKAWFEKDAGDALAWLSGHRLVNSAQEPLWRLRRD